MPACFLKTGSADSSDGVDRYSFPRSRRGVRCSPCGAWSGGHHPGLVANPSLEDAQVEVRMDGPSRRWWCWCHFRLLCAVLFSAQSFLMKTYGKSYRANSFIYSPKTIRQRQLGRLGQQHVAPRVLCVAQKTLGYYNFGERVVKKSEILYAAIVVHSFWNNISLRQCYHSRGLKSFPPGRAILIR